MTTTDSKISYVQLMRLPATFELLQDPNAFTLLAQIALRAKRTDDLSIHGVEISEALIGDYRSAGMTEKEYRGAKKRLERLGLASFRGTNRGTIAKLLSPEIFDINPERPLKTRNGNVLEEFEKKGRTKGGQKGDQKESLRRANDRDLEPLGGIIGAGSTSGLGRTKGEQRATNKNDKNDKKKETYDGADDRPFPEGVGLPAPPGKAVPMPDHIRERLQKRGILSGQR